MPSQANPLAGLPLDYLIGADGPQSGKGDRITETPYGVRPAAGGCSIAYCNLRREEGEPAEYGPYTTVFNRYNRWSKRGLWQDIFATLASCAEPPGVTRAIDSIQIGVGSGFFPLKRNMATAPEPAVPVAREK